MGFLSYSSLNGRDFKIYKYKAKKQQQNQNRMNVDLGKGEHLFTAGNECGGFSESKK